MASFIAAGTAYATHGVNMIPFFIFYSMFGFQRIGDLIWAGRRHARARGFLVGGTAGRTTLGGRGPAAPGRPQPRAGADRARPRHGLRPGLRLRAGGDHRGRHHADVPRRGEQSSTTSRSMNETYAHAGRCPRAGVREGILQGHVPLPAPRHAEGRSREAQLLGSGAILNEALKAQRDPRDEVRRGGRRLERHQLQGSSTATAIERRALEPAASRPRPRVPYVAEQLAKDAPGVFVAASDYMKVLPDAIARWLPRPLHSLGTDGFGRSDSREALRDFFEVDARYIALATLHELAEAARRAGGRRRRRSRTWGSTPTR